MPVNPARPLSPHLQVYKPQLTSILSIMHRATGVGLALGLPVLVAWLVVLAANQRIFETFNDLFQNPIGHVLLFGWSWAFFFHACTGIRHLFWDAGYFLGIKNIYRTGWLAIGLSTLITGYVWFDIENGDWMVAGIILMQFLGAMIVLACVLGVLLWLNGLIPRAEKKNTSMRGPLAKARGLGAAKEGTAHWWALRVTSAALVLLSIYVVASFFVQRVYSDYVVASIWLTSPFAAVLMILFVGVGFHHAANGLQVVIEDYVRCEKLKLASIVAIKFIATALALLAAIAVLKILLFTIIAGLIKNAAGQ